LTRPAPRLIEGGRILVTTLATFDRENDARAFLRGLRGVEVKARERMPREIEALERHGLALVPPPGPARDARSAGPGRSPGAILGAPELALLTACPIEVAPAHWAQTRRSSPVTTVEV
jgi:hypothetical protein